MPIDPRMESLLSSMLVKMEDPAYFAAVADALPDTTAAAALVAYALAHPPLRDIRRPLPDPLKAAAGWLTVRATEGEEASST